MCGLGDAGEQDTQISEWTLGKLRGRPYLPEPQSEGEGMTPSQRTPHVNGRKKLNAQDLWQRPTNVRASRTFPAKGPSLCPLQVRGGVGRTAWRTEEVLHPTFQLPKVQGLA